MRDPASNPCINTQTLTAGSVSVLFGIWRAILPSIDDGHIKLLQDFRDRFIRRILRLANSVPKVMLEYDTGMPPMKWRIAQRKLIFVNRIMAKPAYNITRKALMQETIYKIKGLATESRTLCLSLGLPSVMAAEVTKNEIKQAIKTKIREECFKRMQEGTKSKDRVDLNPDETQYLQRLSLSNCRVYFRYRSRCIPLVKMNQKVKKNLAQKMFGSKEFWVR